MHQMMADLGLEAAHEIRERLEEDPKQFRNNELLGIVERTADRTGHGPVTTQNQNHLHVHLASRLEEARKRMDAVKLIEHDAPA